MTHTNTEAVSDELDLLALVQKHFTDTRHRLFYHDAAGTHISADMKAFCAALSRRSASNTGGVEVKSEMHRAASALLNTLWQTVYSGTKTFEENWAEMDRRFPQARWLQEELKASRSLAAEAEPVASVDHHAHRVAHIACPHFIADPCGSSKCAGCGKRRAEHRAHPSSPVSAEVTEEMVRPIVLKHFTPTRHRVTYEDEKDGIAITRVSGDMMAFCRSLLSSINGGRENG